jgi:hypothetical protein
MSAAAYKFIGDHQRIPGATWADGYPGPAPNTPLPGIPTPTGPYMPLDVHRRRTYESDDHGWVEVKPRRSDKAGWRGAKKNKSRAPVRQTLEELISSLSGKSYLIA